VPELLYIYILRISMGERGRAEDDHNKMYTNICLPRVLFMCLAMIVCRFLLYARTHTLGAAVGGSVGV